MVKKTSIADLKKSIARERARISSKSERLGLERELKNLQTGQKTSVKLAKRFGRGLKITGKRFGRGLKITGKKVGSALIKQGQKIAAEQERQRILEAKSKRIVRTKVRKIRRKIPRREPEDNFFGGVGDLGF